MGFNGSTYQGNERGESSSVLAKVGNSGTVLSRGERVGTGNRRRERAIGRCSFWKRETEEEEEGRFRSEQPRRRRTEVDQGRPRHEDLGILHDGAREVYVVT